MSALVEISSLSCSRPGADASAVVVAEWYERKAVVLHQIADTSPSEHAAFEVLADQAHQHALRLLAAGEGEVSC